jgi:hypothetical protein
LGGIEKESIGRRQKKKKTVGAGFKPALYFFGGTHWFLPALSEVEGQCAKTPNTKNPGRAGIRRHRNREKLK